MLCRNFPWTEQVYDIVKCEIEVGENIGQVHGGMEMGVGPFWWLLVRIKMRG